MKEMKQEELEEKIAALEKEVAELKMRPYIQYLPCYQQHYSPQPYYPQLPPDGVPYYPVIWNGNQMGGSIC